MTTIHLSIFHTNDLHGRLEAMARLSSFARRLRIEAEAQGRLTFFWDAGDAADRRVQVSSVSKGAAFSPILNAMGYTLQAMGNDIVLTYGPHAMATFAARTEFPILAANCRDGTGPLPQGLQENALIPLSQGLTMGVIGLTAPWRGAYQIYGLHFPDFFELARDLVDKLRQQGVAPVIVLSHLGLSDDRRLAEKVNGIDLIIGGHSHDRLSGGEERNGVLIVQTGEYAEALGRVDLTLDARTGRVLARSAQVMDVPEDELPDPAVLAAISVAEQEVAGLMAQPIGVLQAPLDLDYFQECGLGNLSADAVRQRMGAEAAILSGGLFHQGLLAGTITVGRLSAACFTTANPGLTEVRGSQIIAALERGLDPAVAQFKHHAARGAPTGIPQISGLIVEYDPAAGVGRRVQRVRVQGQPLELERVYRLAHTDAETMVDAGYLVLDAGQKTKYEVPTILPEVIQDYLRQHSPVPAPERGRWRAVARYSQSEVDG